ncbi:MAG: O-antigen ligase family protein [Variibacter sp.]
MKAAAPWRSTTSDWLAAAAIFALPWSTSATSILVVAWMIVVVPSLDGLTMRRCLTTPAAYLPVVLWLFAAIGMLWSDATWAARLDGFRAFHKLLLIPLLMMQFSRSSNGLKVVLAFLLSSTVLLAYSWASLKWPSLIWRDNVGRAPGIPIKDYIYQSICFVLAACGLIHLIISMERNRRYGYALAAVLLTVLFLANMAYVATARTALVILPVLLLTIGVQRFGLRRALVPVIIFAGLAAVAWNTSPYLRTRIQALVLNTKHFDPESSTSEAQRIELWRKSAESIADAPIIGHGTGYIRDAMLKAREGNQGAAALVVNNPHNQTFAVGIQLGIAGMAILFAMWIAHLLLFAGHSWASWFGLMVVLQNIVACLFNSHLSDFTAGWLYVLGVGILGGTVLRERAARKTIVAAEIPNGLSRSHA